MNHIKYKRLCQERGSQYHKILDATYKIGQVHVSSFLQVLIRNKMIRGPCFRDFLQSFNTAVFG
jgi:hypothetical protein